VSYFILRHGQQYGPYAPADLERYLTLGGIVTTDLARTEEMNQWLPLSQIIGNAVPAPPAPLGNAGPLYGRFTAQPQIPAAPAPVLGHLNTVQPMPPPAQTPACLGYPLPPEMYAAPLPPGGLHWGLLLLGSIVTAGLFGMIWAFVQANWVRKIDQQSKAMVFLSIGVLLHLLGQGINLSGEAPLLALAVLVGSLVCIYVALFGMRTSMVRYYNAVERTGLKLSGVMTFFCGILYFQYHLQRILKAKREGQPIQPKESYPYARPA
jgi:uncharacterized membrane protein (DUF441 family)